MPFTEEQAEFFFGREDERTIIAANLMAARLTLLYGPSGVGKSSVLNAGVAHDLRTEAADTRAKRGSPDFAIVIFRSWRDDPIAALDRSIAREIGTPVSGATFGDRLHAAAEAINGDLMIILDQFEEYFLYHGSEDGDGTFSVEFPRAVNRRDLRVSFLISMREDSIAKLDFFKGRIPNLFDNYLRIDHLDAAQAHDAIVKPIERFNQRLALHDTPIAIEPALVDTVLAQVTAGRVAIGGIGKGRVTSSAGAPAGTERVETPYLQLVMTRLWHEEIDIGSHVLRASTLERLGGADEIVATHLDAALDSLTEDERAAAASIFQFLVTPSGTKIALGVDDLAQYAKRKPEDIQPLLVRLSAGENRILTPVAPPPDRPARESYQIFHDVLANAVLEWRNGYERVAERAAADARAEEQRKRAEHEAQIAARLRKQRTMLGILLVAATALLVVIGVLSFLVRSNAARLRTTAGNLSELQRAFSAADERVKALLAQAVAAQRAAVAGYQAAQQWREEANKQAQAGNAEAARALIARADSASKDAETKVDEFSRLNVQIDQEQKAADSIRAQADELSKLLPPPETATPVAAAPVAAEPVVPDVPTNPTSDPPPARLAAPPSSTSVAPRVDPRYKDTYKRAIDAGNRGQWDQARQLLEEALTQNSVESTERIPISGFGNYEQYLPLYHLGVAFRNLGDCTRALEMWQRSESAGSIQKTNRYSALKTERSRCSGQAR